MGGINCGWLGSEPRLAESESGDMNLVRRLSIATAPEGGECPDSAYYTLAFALQLMKMKENLSG
jgi:hypothetical protein